MGSVSFGDIGGVTEPIETCASLEPTRTVDPLSDKEPEVDLCARAYAAAA